MGWFSRKPSQEKLVEELTRKKEMLRLLEDPATIYQFGLMAYDGDGQEQDYSEAAAWFRMSAEQGHSGAQHNLALMYEEGLSVEQDYEQSFQWYLKAANQGNVGSQNNLGVAYLKGQGVEQNDEEAAKWFHKAAEQNLASAQYFLGLLYSLGNGVPKNLQIAQKWLQSAADQGIVEAEEMVKDIVDEEESIRTKDHSATSALEHQMEAFIDNATKIIYSNDTEIYNALEEELLAGLSVFELFIAYIAISVAARTRIKIRKTEIEIALENILYPKLQQFRDLRTPEEYTQFLEIYKLEAMLNVRKIEAEFFIGRIAYEHDKHSYQGILYNTEKSKKRPLSIEERQEVRTLAESIATT